MPQLCLLMVTQVLVTFATSDLAVRIDGGAMYLYLTEDNLNMMHMCLCNTSHSSCTFDVIRHILIPTYSEASQIYSSTEYSNRYTCGLLIASINCTRRIQIGQQEAAIKHEGKSFSLHGIKTCDINCVDFVWDHTVANIMINRDIISDELCAAGPPSSTQEVTNTKLIIIIAAESSVLIILIISVIIAVCVRIKRKRQVKKRNTDSIKMETGNYLEVYNTGNLYDVSTKTSSLPCLDLLPEPHYHEFEQDRPDPHQIGETLS